VELSCVQLRESTPFILCLLACDLHRCYLRSHPTLLSPLGLPDLTRARASQPEAIQKLPGQPPTPVSAHSVLPCSAGARTRACPFLAAPPEPPPPPHRSMRRALANPVGRRQSAGRPGAAGQDRFLVTGRGPPRAARGRTAAARGVSFNDEIIGLIKSEGEIGSKENV
jgi:hypothetical protein